MIELKKRNITILPAMSSYRKKRRDQRFSFQQIPVETFAVMDYPEEVISV
jgi:hypothetical protein